MATTRCRSEVQGEAPGLLGGGEYQAVRSPQAIRSYQAVRTGYCRIRSSGVRITMFSTMA